MAIGTKLLLPIMAIYALLAVSAFICFSFICVNYPVGIWALLSGIIASLIFILHYHYLKDSLHANVSRKILDYLVDFGMIGFISGSALTLFYIFQEIYYMTGIFPTETSIIIRIVWAFMMTKLCLVLNIMSKKYLRTYNDHQIFSENPNVEET